MKKRYRWAALALALTLLLGLAPGGLAADRETIVVLRLDSNQMTTGGAPQPVDAGDPNVYPFSENGRTLVPVSRIVAAFGGVNEWDNVARKASLSLGERRVVHGVGTNAVTVYTDPEDTVGRTVTMEVSSRIIHDRTYMPARYVLEGLGLYVAYEGTNRLVVVSDKPLEGRDLLGLSEAQTLLRYTAPKTDPISLQQSKRFDLASGPVTAHVVTVDMNDPRVTVRAALPSGKLNTTAPFETICAGTKARVVMNANFFNVNEAIKDPVGHVMADGAFVLGVSGIPAVGFTDDNQVRFGRPHVFFRIETTDGGRLQRWTAYEYNDYRNNDTNIVLYTPAFGTSVAIRAKGAVMTVENGVITGYRAVEPGTAVAIPANGFIVHFCDSETKTDWHQTPAMGRKVTVTPCLVGTENEGFQLDRVTDIVSGAPTLVKDGKMVTTIVESEFAKDNRFAPKYAAPRSAIGVTADRKLILVNVASATIQQMRELMVALKCVDAINLDGGASTALYVDGKTIDPAGRQLATTLQIFVDG